MTPAALLAVVYRFYPRGLRVGSPGYKETPEYRRRFAATRQAAAEFPKWRGMLDRLGARYGIHDLSLHMFGSGVDSAYSVKLSIPGMGAEHDALAENGKLGSQIKFGCCVSFLGPYYVVCHTNVATDEPYVQDVTREVQATSRQPIAATSWSLPSLGTCRCPTWRWTPSAWERSRSTMPCSRPTGPQQKPAHPIAVVAPFMGLCDAVPANFGSLVLARSGAAVCGGSARRALRRIRALRGEMERGL